MRLVAVEITPKGNAILITGKNGMGKSSVLDAIMAIFCGKKYHPEKPIRDGQERAEIVCETENFIIKRTFTEKGGSVSVTNAEGMVATGAQGLLDKLVGSIAFDPMSFYRDCKEVKRRREQLTTLMKLVGLDFDDINVEIAKVKKLRSDVKTAKDTYDFEAGQITVPEGTPDELVSLVELTEKLKLAAQFNAEQCEIMQTLESGKGVLVRHQESLSDNLELIGDLRLRLAKAEEVQKVGQETLIGLVNEQTKVAELLEPVIDIQSINLEITEADAKNMAIRGRVQKMKLVKKSAEKSKEFAKLGKDAKALEAKKAKRLADAKMPIEGLSVNEDTILYEGIPLSQVNESMQLRIAVAISMALNPKLRVILMKGNDLDEANLEAVCEMAKEKDYQVWIEKVSDDKKNKTGFIIEDGSVVEADKDADLFTEKE